MGGDVRRIVAKGEGGPGRLSRGELEVLLGAEGEE